MKTKSIRQTVNISADPQSVFDALMDSRKHSAFTGDTARISRNVGGKFSAYGGYCYGVNINLVKSKKIVQTWRASDWPEGHFTKASFDLRKTKSGTKLTFTQTGVPANQLKSIKQGWTEFYWEPMKKMLGNK